MLSPFYLDVDPIVYKSYKSESYYDYIRMYNEALYLFISLCIIMITLK